MIAAKYKLGIIGCGNMGEAILRGIVASKILTPSEICVSDKRSERLKQINNNYKVPSAKNISELVCNSEYILIAVKPQDFNTVILSIKDNFNSSLNKIISVAAGISTNSIEKRLSGKASVIRIMPNTPALVNKGISAVSRGKYTAKKDIDFVKEIISSLGQCIIIDEKFQNTITAISGSGPAYFLLFCKYLIESANKRGIDRKISEQLVMQTMIGAGEMLKKYKGDTDFLIKMVASPGGTTERAIAKFNEHNLNLIISEAVESAENRAGEIEKEFNDVQK
ncbi:MAG: pyrroline-5-carboxylate reductase [Actinobacteria bacterium]|nr:pyrroline-5-carboxylate reductase [Actinomycetota bacterium]